MFVSLIALVVLGDAFMNQVFKLKLAVEFQDLGQKGGGGHHIAQNCVGV